MEPRYHVKDAEGLETPALLFYEANIRANVAKMIELVGGPARLRPHVKTHKCREVLALQRAAGIERFKAATLKEAELVAAAGAAEVTVAYPITGPFARRVAGLQRRYPDVRVSVLADHPTHVAALGEAARAESVDLDVFVDVNS